MKYFTYSLDERNEAQTNQLLDDLNKCAHDFQSWLVDNAYSTWWDRGADPRGGFYERLNQTGQPELQDSRRARVQPRQLYCYAQAKLIGWSGPSHAAMEHALSWFENSFLRDDGYYGSISNSAGKLIDSSIDLYNQAFALFGYASAAGNTPQRSTKLHAVSLDLLKQLKFDFSHHISGFRQPAETNSYQCTNPHMHMFEAALAWEVVSNSDPRWHELANELALLALDYLIDKEHGFIREFYDSDWRPITGEAGKYFEPGHQFEWAWLLTIWSQRRQDPRALEQARLLFDVAETYGICQERQVAIMGVYDDFTVRDSLARLWSQTEWLKAAIKLSTVSTGEERLRYLKSSLTAYAAIFKFIPDQASGLWLDKWPNGQHLMIEPAPASTFYHLVGAALELILFRQTKGTTM